MHRNPGTHPSRHQHRALVERIVSMQGALKQSLGGEHPHVRQALARLRAEHALRAKLQHGAVLDRAGRKIDVF